MKLINTCSWIVALTAIPCVLQAEEDKTGRERIELGISAGIDFGMIGGSELDDPGVDYSGKFGFTGGVISSLRMTELFSVQVEGNYASKNIRGDTPFPSSSAEVSIKYLEFPALIRVNMPVSPTIAPYFYAGPALSVMVDADASYDDGRHLERDERVETLDIGLMLGAGSAVNLGLSGSLTFDVRYNLGLRNRNRSATSESEVLNRAIYLTVGYRADLATLGRLFGSESR
jgi:hypothetical protein